jgi:hypothetical protein
MHGSEVDKYLVPRYTKVKAPVWFYELRSTCYRRGASWRSSTDRRRIGEDSVDMSVPDTAIRWFEEGSIVVRTLESSPQSEDRQAFPAAARSLARDVGTG